MSSPDVNAVETIRKQVGTHKVLLYMKGSPSDPQCEFSASAVRRLKHYGVTFFHVNVLEAPAIRASLPQFSGWPTYPQLWIGGILIGGSDTMESMHLSGELRAIFDREGIPVVTP